MSSIRSLFIFSELVVVEKFTIHVVIYAHIEMVVKFSVINMQDFIAF